MMKIVILVVALYIAVQGRPQFRDLIPNGHSVPDPCSMSGGIWAPVGHYNPGHPTVLINPFGRAFRKVNFTWTQDLCMDDSDHDGVSNGAELGDPNCVWKVGATPEHRASGQPGICEPVGDAKCNQQHFRCDCLEHCHGLH